MISQDQSVNNLTNSSIQNLSIEVFGDNVVVVGYSSKNREIF
jgi:hypothetical protein